ncbi:PREDICTED: G-box-binding factor 1-like [Nicotiana attenuata]|uniref:Bzip transcription factor 11 n=1 Tax=Nicotiana attenuata TaxID=49451 RepID=A0A314L172_NICAT|nr:PREDICTED: G-box-binding factor 1-like [Nicotiana attenuata]OIT35386.1 bzip transcription factor 11 [Nicotiana attenuata]
MLSTFPAIILSSDGTFSNQFPSFYDGFIPWDCFDSTFIFPEQRVELTFLPNQTPTLEPVISHSGSGSDNSKPDSPNSSFGSDEPNMNNHSPWKCLESAFILPEQGVESVFSPKQSPTPEPVLSNSGLSSDKYKSNSPNSSSGSDEPNMNNDSPNSGSDISFINERKRKRMISNRESARRSRMRKQKHVENLRNQANRLKVENRDLKNRVHLVTNHCQLVQRNNEMLRTESVLLQQRLENIREILLARQLQQQLYHSSAWPCNNYVEQRPQVIINQPIINHH